MNTNPEMPEIDPEMPENAVSVYGQSDSAYEDFPVLKAFQQYIDAEQEKARKRLFMICAFFGALMFVVIAVFVMLLVNASSRNQQLNDRLVEYAMKDRDLRTGSAVVVQPAQDSAMVLALTAKLDELQKRLSESQATTEQLVSNATAKAEQAAIEAAKPKGPTPEELEIARLKALLSAEREKQAIEREKQRQAELEEYRRKHYPELYKQPQVKEIASRPERMRKTRADDDHEELLKEVDEILGDGEAVRYFDDKEDDEIIERPRRKTRTRRTHPAAEEAEDIPVKKEYSIPVEIRGSRSRWSVPND